MGIPIVDELGLRIDRTWRARHYAQDALPEIAIEALQSADLAGRLSPDDIVRQVLQRMELPQQIDLQGTFGQPPLTLFMNGRFCIQALHWVDASTTIHQHAFSGAFQVLAGSSIETAYSFQPIDVFDGHFLFGNLTVVNCSFLQVGALRLIRSGTRGLIHSLFHLERPSVTIVVRTINDPWSGPQFDYTRAGIAIDPFFADPACERIVQFVRLLGNVDHPRLEEWVGDLVANSELHTAYRALESCSRLADQGLVERLLQRLSAPHARRRIARSFDEQKRLVFLQSRRAQVQQPDARFFLGVLMNARTRKDALSLIAQRWAAEDAAGRAAACLRDLASITLKLQVAGVPWSPNVLGLPTMGVPEEHAVAAELRGDRPPASTLVFIEKLRRISALAALFENAEASAETRAPVGP